LEPVEVLASFVDKSIKSALNNKEDSDSMDTTEGQTAQDERDMLRLALKKSWPKNDAGGSGPPRGGKGQNNPKRTERGSWGVESSWKMWNAQRRGKGAGKATPNGGGKSAPRDAQNGGRGGNYGGKSGGGKGKGLWKK
jgi:hypothetical protein